MDNLKEFKLTLYCCPKSDCLCEYKSKFNLKKHVEYKHIGEKPFVCLTCGRALVSKQNLIEHQHIHTGTKAYKCVRCGADFRYMSQFALHRRTHDPSYEGTLDFVNRLQESEI